MAEQTRQTEWLNCAPMSYGLIQIHFLVIKGCEEHGKVVLRFTVECWNKHKGTNELELEGI